jgi:hypothetical protein
MNAEKLDQFAARNETLYEFITRRAAAAPDMTLWTVMSVACLGGILLALSVPRLWPLTAACGTVASIALWGMLEHQRSFQPARWIHIVERILVVFGCILAFIAMMGLLYLALGDGWIS